MKKALRIIFNVFWIICVGINSAIVNAITGAACCITLVGIPFGLQHFKFIPLAFAPAGKVVVTRSKKHPIMNFLWFFFGGFFTSLYYSLLGLFFMITIIGYPIAVQLFKVAAFTTAPFGAEIVIEGKYSSTKDTPYDANVVATRILENPDKTIDTPTGASTSTRNYLLSFRDAEFIAAEKKFKTARVLGIIGAIVIHIVWIAYVIMLFTGVTNTIYLKIFPETSSPNPFASIISIFFGYGMPKILPLGISVLILMMGMSLLVLNPVAMAKKTLYGKILSPGNITWLINCYPDNTDIKRFFFATPEKMLKKLDVAMSRNASPTPVVIEELSYYATADDEGLDDVLGIANSECGADEDGIEATEAPVAEAAPEEVADMTESPEAQTLSAEAATEEITEAAEIAEPCEEVCEIEPTGAETPAEEIPTEEPAIEEITVEETLTEEPVAEEITEGEPATEVAPEGDTDTTNTASV